MCVCVCVILYRDYIRGDYSVPTVYIGPLQELLGMCLPGVFTWRLRDSNPCRAYNRLESRYGRTVLRPRATV